MRSRTPPKEKVDFAESRASVNGNDDVTIVNFTFIVERFWVRDTPAFVVI